MASIIRIHAKNYSIILLTCILVSILGFVFRPHDCRPTYGPAPYFYNTDLTLWVDLANQPIKHLKESILSNRPLFAYLGWLFAQPVHAIIGDATVTSGTRASGNVSISAATVVGLFLANYLCYFLSAIVLYHFTMELFGNFRTGLVASLSWVTSFFAYSWSYHPVNQMGGLFVIFIFPLSLWSVAKNNTFLSNLFLGLMLGVLLLIKAYYILPVIYLAWGIFRCFDWKNLSTGFIASFVPTILWQKIYVVITGIDFVDYHLGGGGLFSFLFQKLEDLPALIQIYISSFISLPKIILNAAGWPVALIAIFYFIYYWKENRDFIFFSGVYLVGFYIFLTVSGFFIPRHGSDFFPLVFPATAFVVIRLWDCASKPRKCLYVGIWLVYILFSYTLTWLCVSEIL